MFKGKIAPLIACAGLAACTSTPHPPATRDGAPGGSVVVSPPAPLAIGDTFTIDSRIMGEPRRVNVFEPSVYGEPVGAPLPVLCVLDGGAGEDFLHVAGLVQILVSNGGMRPFLVVGIENTQRRRDMTGPTSNPEDRTIAPIVGGSGAFRRFMGEELLPVVRSRYTTTEEAAIVGESLAGLFVVETLLLEPALFDSYVAIDPSLWWADEGLLRLAGSRPEAEHTRKTSLFLASSGEPELASLAARLADALASHPTAGLSVHHAPLPGETHATVYHPAALLAFRTILAPAEE